MSIVNPLSPDQQRRFTHLGWFAGLVPVYVRNPYGPDTEVCERNGCPEWYFSLAECLFGAFCWVSSAISPTFEPFFPILLTGEIDHGGDR